MATTYTLTKKAKKDEATGFINYVGNSHNWIEEQVAKRTANELTNQTPIVQIFDESGKYHEEASKRINLINSTSWYSEYNNTSFDQVIWNVEHRISPEGRIGLYLRTHEEEFSGDKMPLITLAQSVILEDREDNKSKFAYFIASSKKIQNAYVFTVVVSKLGKIYQFNYNYSQPTLALTVDEVESILKKDKRTNANKNASELIELNLKQQQFVYHQILFNLPNGKSDLDYINGAQLTDMLDEISWAMLWEIQANQTKVVLLTAVASASDIEQKKLASKKLKEWRGQIQVNVETANTTDQQSITVHNPQLQNTLPVYMKTYKEILNLIYQLSGSAKDHESNDKGTAQQSISEIKGLGGSQYETIQIKKKLRQVQLSQFFKRVIEFDRVELENQDFYPENYTIKVIYTTASESDKGELLNHFKLEDELGIKSKARQLMEYDKTISTLEEAMEQLDEIKSQKEKYGEDDGEDTQDPNDPKNKKPENQNKGE